MRPDDQAPAVCPRCGAGPVRRIVYGLAPPALADEPTLELGGCVVMDGDPAWSCGACGHAWGRAGIDQPTLPDR